MKGALYAAVLALFVLAACGGQPDESSPGLGASPTDMPTSAAVEQPAAPNPEPEVSTPEPASTATEVSTPEPASTATEVSAPEPVPPATEEPSPPSAAATADTSVGADRLESARPVIPGEATPGEIAQEGDVDFFVFGAEEGQLLLIDVALGSLGDSEAVLYDAEGFKLAYNDDHGHTTASRISWEAEYSGNHYVAVKGWADVDAGSYTLIVAIVDATAVTVGGVAPGEIADEGDVEFFVFEAEEGVYYRIDVALETLGDSIAVLYDSDWTDLADNHSHVDSSVSSIHWQAEYSGNHYVAVAGHWSTDTGTYTVGVVTP